MPNHTLFEQAIYDVSTPNHELYGQHLNHEEVRAIVKPRDESIEAVLAWLKSSGLPESDIEHDNEWINFSVSVAVSCVRFRIYKSVIPNGYFLWSVLRFL